MEYIKRLEKFPTYLMNNGKIILSYLPNGKVNLCIPNNYVDSNTGTVEIARFLNDLLTNYSQDFCIEYEPRQFEPVKWS